MAKRRHRHLRRAVTALLALAVVLGLLGVATIKTSYQPSAAALAALQSDDEVTVTFQDDGDLVFAPASGASDRGIVFYPGGKVDQRAYAPLMQHFARRGFTCVLVRMPLNLAVLDPNAADGEQGAFPEVDHWYLGGHSLGGAMAASYAADHADDYEGLLLCAAFSTKDLGETDLEVASVYGTEDGVLKRDRYEECRANAPQMTEDVIEGGCHAYFGDYGPQAGDGTPTISRQDQMSHTASDLAALAE